MIAVPLIAAFTANALTAALLADLLTLPSLQLAISAATVIAALGAVTACHQVLRLPRRLSDYGLTVGLTWLRRAAAGLAIGTVAVATPAAIALVSGNAHIVAVLSPGQLGLVAGIVPLLIGMALVGFWEELLVRGVFVSEIAGALHGRFVGAMPAATAVVISSTIFGLGHLGQPDHPAYLLTWILAGLVFGTLYVASGDLALPIGAHAAFNIGHNVLIVRADLPGTEALSAITRVEFAPTLLLQVGGLLEIAGFLLIGVLSLLWLRRSAPRARSVPSWTTPSTDGSSPTTLDDR